MTDLMDKLQKLQQKNIGTNEYMQQIELLMMMVQIREEQHITIARFQSGLNLKIWIMLNSYLIIILMT